MTTCPHCKQELRIPGCAYFNCDQYGTSATVTTECCGHAVSIQPIRSYRIEAYEGRDTEDDWGVPFKKTENVK